MALVNCVHCGASVSDQARRCPKCDKPEPKNPKVKIWHAETRCRECKGTITTQDAFRGATCSNCGYRENYMPCAKCASKAIYFSHNEGEFQCEKHKKYKCQGCGKVISYYELKVHYKYWRIQGCPGGSGTERTNYCTSCYDKRTREEKISNKPSGTCFIATAAYGDPNNVHVLRLKKFRDLILLRFRIGRKFNNIYNKYSPNIASLVERHYWIGLFLKAAVLFPASELIKCMSLDDE